MTLANDKHGVIRYIGPTEISDGKPLLGVELEEDDPTAQDGTVGSKSYFKTEMGRGVFVRRASVVAVAGKEIQQIIKEQQAKQRRASNRDGDQSEEEEEEEEELQIGYYVELESGVKGILR